MEPSVHTPPLQDKSLWLAIIVPILVMVGKLLKIELPAEQIALIIAPILTFILSSKAKQAMVLKAQADAAGQAAAAGAEIKSPADLVNK